MLFEDYGLLLLLAHTAAALCCVGISTHLVLWLRPWLRGQSGNHRSVRRFSLLGVGAWALTMGLGLALYPNYRVRVRAEYLENPSAVRRATEEESVARRRAERRNEESRRFRSGDTSAAVPLALLSEEERAVLGTQAQRRTVAAFKLTRWFDVKEHWSALGLMLAGALALLLSVAPNRYPNRRICQVTFAMAFVSAAIAWSAAIIGLVLSAARSVGRL